MKTLLILIAALTLVSCGRPPSAHLAPPTTPNSQSPVQQTCVNLNTATAEELERLKEIGEVIARRVIDYRERNGRFRRPEEIIIIEGFSEQKYRKIAGSICVE